MKEMYKYGERIRLTSYIKRYLTTDILLKIERTSRRYDLNNNQKGQIVTNILDDRCAEIGVDGRFLGQGTNRLGYQIEDLVFKIALDLDGHIDNKREFKYTDRLQPYVIKVYECTQDGLIAVTERVTAFDDYDRMLEHQESIRKILTEIADEFFIGDVGIISKNAANWGMRSSVDGDLVMLDFAYIYATSYQLFTCTCNKGDILHYDKDFNYLVCPSCKRQIDFSQIRRKISKEAQNEEIGDLAEESYLLKSEMEMQVVNPDISEVEEPDEVKEERKKQKKMAKKNKKYKSFEETMEHVGFEDQADALTNLIISRMHGKTEVPSIEEYNVPIDEIDIDDEVGDPEAGEALLNKIISKKFHGDNTPVVEEEPEEEYEENEDDEYADMRAAADEFFNTPEEERAPMGKHPLEDIDEEPEVRQNNPLEVKPVLVEKVDDPEVRPNNPLEVNPVLVEKEEDDYTEELDAEKGIVVRKHKNPHQSDFAQVGVMNVRDRVIQFRSTEGSVILGGPDIKNIVRKFGCDDKRDLGIPSAAIPMIYHVVAALSKPAVICNGHQMDTFIFPNNVENGISVFDDDRFLIHEIMGDKTVAPADPAARRFAIYDLAGGVKFVTTCLNRYAELYGSAAVNEYLKALLAIARLKMELNDVDYDVVANINNMTPSSECKKFHDLMMTDAKTERPQTAEDIYFPNVKSWGVDEHESDFLIHEELSDKVIPDIADYLDDFSEKFPEFNDINDIIPVQILINYNRFEAAMHQAAKESAENEEPNLDDYDVVEEVTVPASSMINDEPIDDDYDVSEDDMDEDPNPAMQMDTPVTQNVDVEEVDPDDVDFGDMVIDTVHK